MWLPIWVFDGNGFTMVCLAVWIRNVALRWDLPQVTIRSGAVDATASTAPVNVARISVATSGAGFTASEAVFRSVQPGCGLTPGDRFCHLGAGRSRDSAWSAPGAKQKHGPTPMSAKCHYRAHAVQQWRRHVATFHGGRDA